MTTFHLHNLREFVRMTSYHDFHHKPLAVLCSWWMYRIEMILFNRTSNVMTKMSDSGHV